MRALLWAVLAASFLRAGEPDRRPAVTTLIYMVNRADAIADFAAHAEQTSIIAPQTFSMDAQGFVMGEVPAEVLRIAAEKHVAVMPLVVNRGFNQPLMHTVLDDRESRARVIRYLLYYALRDGYIGFQFDYENIHYSYRDRFSAFFREAAREFHRHRLQLSAAVVGRSNDTRNSKSPGGWDNWSGVYDYAELGKWADFISIMAYDEHGSFGGPGPVAGLPWVRGIAEYSAKTIPRGRVSLGVPFYGRQWDAAEAGKWRSKSTRFRDAVAALGNAEALWDERESSPHIRFESAGSRSELWYEDARSLRSKVDLAREMGLAGISAWALGQEDPAFWNSLESLPIRHVRAAAAAGSFDERSKRAARMLARGM